MQFRSSDRAMADLQSVVLRIPLLTSNDSQFHVKQRVVIHLLFLFARIFVSCSIMRSSFFRIEQYYL